jgi:hypothetical protein
MVKLEFGCLQRRKFILSAFRKRRANGSQLLSLNSRLSACPKTAGKALNASMSKRFKTFQASNSTLEYASSLG